MKQSLKINFIVISVLASVLIMFGSAFAASTVNTPTAKLINAKSIAAADDEATLNDVIITETGVVSYKTAGGKFTIKIPSTLKLVENGYGEDPANTDSTTGTITRSTTILGTKAAPHKLYLDNSGGSGGDKGVIFLYHSASGVSGSANAILSVYHQGGVTSGYGYTPGYNSAYLAVAQYGVYTTYASAGANGRPQVGQIYLDDTTNEIVITLAGKSHSDSSYLEAIVLNQMRVIPADTVSTDTDCKITISDGDPDGNDGIGISSHTVTVATLTATPGKVYGAATGTSNAPPTIPAGKVSGQAIGRLKITVIGAANVDDNKLTIALDNGAKFHTGAIEDAANKLGTGNATSAIQVGTSSWGKWADAFTNSSLVVNASGELVITLGSGNIADEVSITIPRNTSSQVIDTSGVTTAGDITATVTGSGTNFAGISGSAVVATAALTGVSLSFVDDTTSGFSTLYTGRTYETIGTSEKLRMVEAAPSSLLQGGSITMTLNQGAKFQSGTSLAIGTTTGNTSLLALPATVSVGKTSVNNVSTTVTTGSSTKAGSKDLTSMEFDLKSATAGSLQVTFAGSAGAAGTVTIATIIDATATSIVGDAPSLVPGTTVILPDIQVVEGKAGALVKDGYIGFKFPATVDLDTTITPTVTTTYGTTSSTSVVTWDTYDADDNVAMMKVATASSSTTGAYTIVLSGLQASLSSSIGSGDVKFTVGGLAASGTYSSNAFDAKTGAKPTLENVTFGTVTSATVPFAGTPTVSGTMVTQTFIAAGNDINKVADIYVFTSGQYYDGSAWTATETAYSSQTTLGSHTIYYDVAGLPTGSNIYIGYGVGLNNTATTMSTNATLVKAYTTDATAIVGTGTGSQTATQNVDDAIELYLNITNDDGYDPATDFAYEWLVFGAIVGGADAGLFFFTDNANAPSTVVAYDATVTLTDLTYAFDHSSDTFKVTDLNMGTLGLAAGDQFWYGYIYGLTGFDITDSTTWSLENYTFITAQ